MERGLCIWLINICYQRALNRTGIFIYFEYYYSWRHYSCYGFKKTGFILVLKDFLNSFYQLLFLILIIFVSPSPPRYVKYICIIFFLIIYLKSHEINNHKSNDTELKEVWIHKIDLLLCPISVLKSLCCEYCFTVYIINILIESFKYWNFILILPDFESVIQHGIWIQQ